MSKKILFLFIFFFDAGMLAAQIKQRIIFIGDAGFKSPAQEKVLSDAASRIIRDSSVVIFLGDNIYPKGLDTDNDQSGKKGRELLDLLIKPFIGTGTKIYFIPGDRDWKRSHLGGKHRIEAQSEYLNSRKDPNIKMIPENGCPGPVPIKINDSLLLLVMDTEWQLAHFGDTAHQAGCPYTSKEESIQGLWELVYQNQDKMILLATHHPFLSNGKYGKRFSFKDHVFPLTNISPALYLPLPLIGSLYPAFRKAFPKKEDLDHPFYKDMINVLSGGFRGFSNAVHIAAHDDGLQLNRDSSVNTPELVTGIGKRHSFIKAEDNTVFEKALPGYIVADQLKGGSIHFSFYGLQKGELKSWYQFQKDFKPRAEWNSPVYTPIEKDTVAIRLRPYYDDRSSFFRFLFGQNYRSAWAAPVRLPVIHLSEQFGGLTFRKMGGGNQTFSMRLKDSSGIQYVLRSIAKTPNRVIPQPLASPFTRLIVDDFYSSQHPYSALVVPPLATAVGVPHASPVLGVVSPDKVLEYHSQQFAGDAYLLERWQPLPPTDNYEKAFKKLREDNDNTFDALNFFRARMLDLLIGDWDRHPDQWRFHYDPQENHRKYLIVPRDRDMALKVTNGLIDGFASYFAIIPHISGFNSNIARRGNAKWGMFNSKFLNAEPASQIGPDQWRKEVKAFREDLTDSVLQTAVSKLPQGIDPGENLHILDLLKKRRDEMPVAMEKYYKFSNKMVDIHGTDTKEFVTIKGVEGENALRVIMQKINKHGKLKDTLMDKVYPKSLTKEIRIYLEKDRDSVIVDNSSSNIKLKIIGGEPKKESHKSYTIINSKKKIPIYDYKEEQYLGKTNKIKHFISQDSANTAFSPVNLYNTWLPMLTGGYNLDDGVSLGVGTTFKQSGGFRKGDYSAIHKLSVKHSLKTNAFAFNYSGDFSDVFGNANLLLDAQIRAPQNTENFFGIGNQSSFKSTGKPYRYFRTRFNLYNFRAAVKKQWGNNTFSVGPAVQYYHYNTKDNTDRFANDINDSDNPLNPDHSQIAQDKTHLGITAGYEYDKRNNPLIPTNGLYFKTLLSGFEGLGHEAHAYGQVSPEFAFFKSLTPNRALVVADRIGGAVTVGNPAFYQYAYLGGRGTLLGFRKYRFAGMQSLYNNLEMRLRLTDFGNYVFRGQIGMTGFFDFGRVWVPREHSKKWHNGMGAGIFLVPAYSSVVNFVMGYSPEDGWYPYVTLGFRF